MVNFSVYLNRLVFVMGVAPNGVILALLQSLCHGVVELHILPLKEVAVILARTLEIYVVKLL